MRISDWSSDVCSSDLVGTRSAAGHGEIIDDDIGRRATAEAGDRYEEGAGRRGDEGTIFGRALRRDDRYLIAEQARHLVGVEVIAVAVAGAADIRRPIIGCIAYRERFGDACGAAAPVGP